MKTDKKTQLRETSSVTSIMIDTRFFNESSFCVCKYIKNILKTKLKMLRKNKRIGGEVKEIIILNKKKTMS